jgi:hypothetical protein
MTFATRCDPCDSTAYCSSEGQNTQYEWLERVEVESLSAVTGENGGYLFTSGPNAVLWEDSSYAVTLEPQFSNSTYSEYFRIWIDLDRDGEFDTTKEEVFAIDGVTSTVNGTLSVPDSIDAGGTRMRISMKFDAAPTPCETFDYGEVEDYCVRLETRSRKDSTGQSVSEPSPDQGAELFPNPATDRVQLRLERVPKEGSYFVLHDALGRKVMQEAVERTHHSFDVSDLSEGTYFYRIVREETLAKGKLILEER